MTELKILKDMEEFIVTSFIPKEQEIEIIKSGPLFDYQEFTQKLPRKPSEFEGKTRSIKCSPILLDKQDLEQEAIKWIKEFEKDCKAYNIYTSQLYEWEQLGTCKEPKPFKRKYEKFSEDWGYEDIIEWIKYFFNITEEDLK